MSTSGQRGGGGEGVKLVCPVHLVYLLNKELSEVLPNCSISHF